MARGEESGAREPVLPLAVPGTASLPGVEAPHRGPVFGKRFAVAADHPAAALAGMRLLESGASAVDAAIAIAAVNVVTKPHRTHLGGDAFALLWHRRSNAVEGLNAGGRAPHKATADQFAGGMPVRGTRASTVPGLVDSWIALHERHGSRPLAELLAPAVELAEGGFPVSTRLAGAMQQLAEQGAGPADEEARALFLAEGGRPYRPGETLRQALLAETLGDIARDGRAGFYGGRVGRAIAEAMRQSDGLIDEEDLAEPTAHWQEPHRTAYRGCTVFEQAMPSQGIVLLEALNIVERFPLGDWGLGSADAVHVMVEATRLAFADIRRYAGDPSAVPVPVELLLSSEHAAERAARIDLRHVREHAPALVPADTTSFVVADEQTAVCYIQSVFWNWGSGFAIPGTGVLMNNRMLGFSPDPTHPNHVAPRKRTLHTLNTFLVLRDGALVVGGGTPGADFQVQTNLQTIAGALDWGLDLQSAIDAPRWVTLGGNRLVMERRFPEATVRDLQSRGHDVRVIAPWDATLARSQVIASREGGGWAVASDLRGEGVALGA